jgi:tRNA modification GTPase
LLDEEKAIVTDIAGTTRDIVEGKIKVNGIILNIIDTAGVRKTTDVVEKIGVEKSLSLIDDADLVILVFNNNEKISDEDKLLLEKTKNKRRIIVVNKIDLEKKLILDEKDIIKISALNNEDIDKLKDKISELFNLEQINNSDFTYLSNSRQIALIKEAIEISKNLKQALQLNVPIDMLEIDIKEICEVLNKIIGESYDDKLVDTLFSNFCLGK